MTLFRSLRTKCFDINRGIIRNVHDWWSTGPRILFHFAQLCYLRRPLTALFFRHFDTMSSDRRMLTFQNLKNSRSKHVPLLDYTPYQEVMGTGGIAPRILNLGWKLVVIMFLSLSHMDRVQVRAGAGLEGTRLRSSSA